jgi:signal peptidase II
VKVLVISVLVIIFDQVTKLLVKGFSIPFLGINHEGMYHGQRIEIFGDFFRLTFIENPGMAFGFDPGSDFKIWLSVFSLVASIGLIIYMHKIRHEHISTRLSIAFILGGAIGNLIDRMFYGVIFNYAPLFYGKVVDFLDFDFFNLTIFGRSYERFPIFNIADSAVTIGVLLLLIFYSKMHQDDQEEPASKISPAADTVSPAEGNSEATGNEIIKNRNRDDDESDNGKEIQF